MDSALLAILACPKCRGSLELLQEEKAEGLCCPACSAVYPIDEGIPVLLVEEALPLQDWRAGKRAGGQAQTVK